MRRGVLHSRRLKVGMDMRLNVKHKYILSYVFVALALIALTNSILIRISISLLHQTLREEQLERGRLLINDMEAQEDSFLDVRNRIKTDYTFQPIYQQKQYSRRLELIDALEHYGNYLLPGVEMILLYCEEDTFYFHRTCANWDDLCRLYWGIDADETLRKMIFEVDSEQIFRVEQLSNDLLFVFPFHLGYGSSRKSVRLVFRVPRAIIEQRFKRVAGLEAQEYSLLYGDALLLGSGRTEWQTVRSPDGRFAAKLADISTAAQAQMIDAQRLLLVLFGVFMALGIGIAVVIGLRQYRPIGSMYKCVGGTATGENELSYIERVISETLRENDTVKKDISARMESLARQTEIIEEQAFTLRHQLLMMLMLGVYRDERDMPDALKKMFSHEGFAVLSVWGVDASAVQTIEGCSTPECTLHAVPLAHQKRISVLVNLEPEYDLRNVVIHLGDRLGKGTTIVSGEITGIEGVPAAFIHSSGSSEIMNTGPAGELLLTPECREMFRAIRMGDTTSAGKYAAEYSRMLNNRQMPLMELKSVYLLVFKKLQNLAAELEQPIPEDIASALMTGASSEELANALYACATGLCGAVEDDQEEPNSEKLRLMAYIDEHACERDMSMSMIESEFGMSRKKAGAIVRQLTDMSFREYVVYLRIERAKLLLLNTGLSVNLIAEKCGYESASYFIKSFKGVTGMTPGQYQKDNL